MAKKSKSVSRSPINAVQVLIEFLDEMRREGRWAYIDESNNLVFREVKGQLVEVTSGNAHLFPEAVVWIPLIAK